MAKVYALSLKQPWAELVVSGKKTIEVRSWATKIRGPVLVHAARIADPRPEAWKWITDDMRPLTELTGGVIGQVELADCIAYPDQTKFAADRNRHLNDPAWFQERGLFGFIFNNAVRRPFHSWTGNVRFFTVEVDD